jgi:hypothetical protein
MNTATAELIDIDFLWFLIDEADHDHQQDGDLITFHHPRRGPLTALQSGRAAMLIGGGFSDRRGLPATAAVLALDITPDDTSRPLLESSGVIVFLPT